LVQFIVDMLYRSWRCYDI